MLTYPQSRREIEGTLEARVKLVAKDTQVLPRLPQPVLNAITYGKETITMAISHEITSYQAPAVTALADYSVSSLPDFHASVRS